MKLECTIGTQGLSDGRVFSRGDIYEVDDDIASTLIAGGDAKAVVSAPEKADTSSPVPSGEHASHFGSGKESASPKTRKTRTRVVKK